MEDGRIDDLVVLLPPLLRALEALGFVARHLDPAEFHRVMAAVGEPDAELAAQRHRLEGWPNPLADVQAALAQATDHALAGFAELRAAPDQPDPMGSLYRALRHLPRAQAALYPLAHGLPPVSRFFLPAARRDDAQRLAALAEAPPRPDTGILHRDGEPGARGGYALYVPEDYAPERAYPLIVALHGGAGNGAGFLWSWLADARARSAILAAPTAIGRTWALSGPDADTPNLARILAELARRYTLDPARRLLTGMSDGGTFSYVTGLEPQSPFTHLAPCSAAFHPMMAQFADPGRISGLPIHITHGALDWMFPVDMARDAQRALATAGAAVTYREVADLSHTFPRELNGAVLDWADIP